MKTLILLLALWPFGSKDKKPDAARPAVDPATKADCFREQRDYSNFRMSLLPQEIELQSRGTQLRNKLALAQQQCGDPAKWLLNVDTLECDEVKSAEKPAPAPAVKPKETPAAPPPAGSKPSN